jgi:hypothetical protein
MNADGVARNFCKQAITLKCPAQGQMSVMAMFQQLSEFSADWEKPQAAGDSFRVADPPGPSAVIEGWTPFLESDRKRAQ